MRVPYQWLREYAPDALGDIVEIEQLLSISGTKVEAIHEFGVPSAENGNAAGFKVGRVVSFEKHPNADKLRLCRVDVGEGELRQIVCGASNFHEGDTVAVVLPGSTMPGGFQIKPAKLRGEESLGMMLSERELELSTDHDGIMILPNEWTPGTPLAEHVPLGDTVIELEITPNRPDCLGVHGVARELAAVTGTRLVDALSGDAEATGAGDVTDIVTVTNEAADLCPRYMARAFTGVTVGRSPYWMRSRLAAAGMRAINNVVDVTNYVMLLTGQPLHAFDADRIAGNQIIVRRAHAGEKVTTLDNVERTLEPWMLSIADAANTVVIAGVMGAEAVEVHAGTTRLVLEAACFDGVTTQRTSFKLGVRSESSARFEKGLDPYLPDVALRLASKLLVELCGAELVPGTIDARGESGGDLPELPVINLPAMLASDVIGLDIPQSRVEEILGSLGYQLRTDRSGFEGGGWHVTVPHWRMFDTTRPIDLVEEIARINGLEKIPATLPARGSAVGALTKGQLLQRTLEDTAASLGLHETCTYAFLPAGVNEVFGADRDEVISLTNPMTREHAELRTTLLGSLLDVVQRNRAVGNDDVALFEIGRTFTAVPAGTLDASNLPCFARERKVLALVAAGDLHGGRFDAPAIAADFPAVAGIVESLVATAGAAVEFRALPATDAARYGAHPGQLAAVCVDGRQVGFVATVHPTLLKSRNIRGVAVTAQLDLEELEAVLPDLHTFSPISTFPPVLQDIALIVPDTVIAADLVRTVRTAGDELLESVRIFDRYISDQIGAGQVSLALRLKFRALGRTLTDDEVAVVREAIVAAAVSQHGARLRDS